MSEATIEKALATKVEDFVDPEHLKNKVSSMLQLATSLGASSAEVGSVVSGGIHTTVRMGDVETIEFNRDKSIAISVYVGKKKGNASTNDLSTASIEAAVQAAVSLAKSTEEDPFAGLADKSSMATQLPDLDLYHPWDLSVQEAIDLTKDCEGQGLAHDSKITNSDGASLASVQSFHVYGNTHGFLSGYPSSRHTLSCVLIAKDPNGMERDYEYTLARDPMELKSPKWVGVQAAEKTVLRLGSQKIPTGQTPVLFASHLASGLLGHFISAISGARLYRKSSFLLESKGNQIFSKGIHISERPYLPKGLASCAFDADGVQTQDREIVTDGVLQDYVLSAYSARKLGLQNTANAGGVHNLMVSHQDFNLDSALKQMDKGLYVTELMGQGINLVTGDYSRGAAGFWVENGKIQFPVHEITIASNLKEMFQGIQFIANDVDTRKSIQCGSILIDNMMVAGD